MMKLRNERGLTLVELMIALAVAIIVSSVMYSLYQVQSQSTTVQTQVAEMQQNLRAGMDIITREIRMAGYDPFDAGGFGITVADADTFAFTADINECNDPTAPAGCVNPNYQVELYTTDAGVVCNDPANINFNVCNLRRTNGGAAVAENIERLEFCYFENNNPNCGLNPANVNDITAMTISILIRSSREDSSYEFDDNKISYESGGGVDWTPGAADGFRRRLVVKTVQLRNMGL